MMVLQIESNSPGVESNGPEMELNSPGDGDY